MDNVLLERLGITLPAEPPNTVESRIFRRKLSELSGQRFDPSAYQARLKQLRQVVSRGRWGFTKLRLVVRFSKEKVSVLNDADTYVGLENISSHGFYEPTSEKESISTASVFHKGQILFPKLRPYLNKTHLTQFAGLCSTEFHVLDAIGAQQGYLCEWLRSRIIVTMTSNLMTGVALPRLQRSDIEALPVPTPPIEIQEEIWNDVDLIKKNAIALFRDANAKLDQAKAEIEAIILGEGGIP